MSVGSEQSPEQALNTLLTTAKAILELPPETSPDAIVALLESYVDHFDRLAAGDGSGMRVLLDDPEIRPVVEEVVSFHRALVEFAKEHLAEAGRHLRSLQIRGRGLRAYVDPLPRRISLGRVRKG
jgi:hypothetical protein